MKHEPFPYSVRPFLLIIPVLLLNNNNNNNNKRFLLLRYIRWYNLLGPQNLKSFAEKATKIKLAN